MTHPCHTLPGPHRRGGQVRACPTAPTAPSLSEEARREPLHADFLGHQIRTAEGRAPAGTAWSWLTRKVCSDHPGEDVPSPGRGCPRWMGESPALPLLPSTAKLGTLSSARVTLGVSPGTAALSCSWVTREPHARCPEDRSHPDSPAALPEPGRGQGQLDPRERPPRRPAPAPAPPSWGKRWSALAAVRKIPSTMGVFISG